MYREREFDVDTHTFIIDAPSRSQRAHDSCFGSHRPGSDKSAAALHHGRSMN